MSFGLSICFFFFFFSSSSRARRSEVATHGSTLLQTRAGPGRTDAPPQAGVTNELPARALVSTGEQEQERRRSLRLSDAFVQLGRDGAPDAAVSNDLWKTFRVCAQCLRFKRLGENNDGGYLTCTDGMSEGRLAAAYSMGVEYHDRWSEDVVRWLRIPVNQFDCTVEWSSCTTCHFYKRCIVAADGQHPVPDHEEEGWSLTKALAETSQADAANHSLLMKMDIEASEWPLFASEPPPPLSQFAQLIVEFHGLVRTENHPMYLRAMQHILGAGLRVAHLHGNNNAPMYYPDGTHRVPDVVEVTFVHGGAQRDGGCASTQVYEESDNPNKAGVPELPPAVLD